MCDFVPSVPASSHVKGREVKGFLFSLTLVLLVVSSATLSPASAWATQTQHVYNWGDPWGDPWGLQYFGPTLVDGVPGTIVQISTSNSASYALTKTGEVWAWGVGRGGALGNGTMPKSTTTPVQVQFPTGVKVASLPSPMPFDTGMAIDRNGNVWGWGADVENSLCLPNGNLLLPTKLPLTHVTQASGAGADGLYLSDGEALCMWWKHVRRVGRWHDGPLDTARACGRSARSVDQSDRFVMGEFGSSHGRWLLLRLGIQPCRPTG